MLKERMSNMMSPSLPFKTHFQTSLYNVTALRENFEIKQVTTILHPPPLEEINNYLTFFHT